MNSSYSKLLGVIAIAAVLLIADISFAQRGRGRDRGMWGGGGMSRLLRNENVQEELELVDDQVQDLEEMQNELRREMMEMFRGGGFRDLDDAERQEKMDEMREKAAERMKELETELKDVLLPHQITRLKELHFQSESSRGGSGGLAENDTMIEALGITDEQKEKMKKAAESASKKLDEKIKKLREQAEAEVLAVLTEDQRKKFKELKGESFDFGQQDQGRFGRRGDRGRGENNGRGDRGRGDRSRSNSDF